jgi:flagellar basal body-associated protein FliL
MAEDNEQKTKETSKPRLTPQAIGAGLILLILAAYFMWMTIEMGTAAESGSAPMFAFLAAAAVGIGAAGLALAIGRRR